MARIAYILDCFPVISETFISQEIRSMEAIGHEITIISLRKPESNFSHDAADLAERTNYVTDISEEEEKNLRRRYRFKFRRMYSYARKQTAESIDSLKLKSTLIADIIQLQKCEHIHAHFAWRAAAYAITSAKLLKLPVSFTCHGSDVYARPWDLALKCQHADMILAVAPTIREDVQYIAQETPCHLVYCGVDIKVFQPATDKSKKNKRWLFVGRLVDCKGIANIIEAWGLLEAGRRPKLDIVGEGRMKEELQKAVQAQGMESDITFLGGCGSSWIAEHGPHYQAFISAFQQGEDGSRDTSPIVLKEAMAMELPIVTTQFVDIPALTGDECSILCPVSSPQALADAVSRISNMSSEERDEMGKSGRERVKKLFSAQQQAESISEILGLQKR